MNASSAQPNNKLTNLPNLVAAGLSPCSGCRYFALRFCCVWGKGWPVYNATIAGVTATKTKKRIAVKDSKNHKVRGEVVEALDPSRKLF